MAHLQPSVAINTERATAPRARLHNWHLLSNDKLLPVDTFIFRRSVAVWSSFAWYVPNMYYYREQINSLSAVHASARRFARVGKRRLARRIDIAGHGRSFHVCARWLTLVSIVNRNKRTIDGSTNGRTDYVRRSEIFPRDPAASLSRD